MCYVKRGQLCYYGGMWEFIVFVGIVILFVLKWIEGNRRRALERRIAHIEKYLERATASGAVAPVAASEESETPPDQATVETAQAILQKLEPSVVHVPTGEESVPEEEIHHEVVAPPQTDVAPAPQAPAETRDDWLDSFLEWLREDWLMKLGGGLVILGMAWFVGYAVAENWIGETGRVLLGMFVGLGVLALGRYRLTAFVRQGSVLMVMGAAILILSLYAANVLYGIVPTVVALGGMFIAACYLGLTSVTTGHAPLAYGNVLLAGIAPFLLGVGELSQTLLFVYLLALTLGAVWVTAVRGWRLPALLALGVVYIYTPLAIVVAGEHEQGLYFAFVFATLFATLSALGVLYDKRVHLLDILLALGTGLFLFVWIFFEGAEAWRSALLVLAAIALAGMSYWVVLRGVAAEYFYTYGGIAAAFFLAATAIELDGVGLTVMLTVEITTLVVVSYLVTRSSKVLSRLSIVYLWPIGLSTAHMQSSAWEGGIVHADALVLIVLMLAFGGVATFLDRESRRLQQPLSGSLATLSRVYVAALVFYVTIFLALWLHGAALTIAYTVEAAALFVFLYRNLRRSENRFALLLPFILPILLSFESMSSSAWDNGIVHADSLALVVLMLTLGSVAHFLGRASLQTPVPHSQRLLSLSYIYWVAAILYGTVILDLWLSGPTLTIAYTLQAAALFWIAFSRLHSTSMLYVLGLPFVAPLLRSIESMRSVAWEGGVWHLDAFVLVLVPLTLLSVAFSLYNASFERVSESRAVLRRVASWLSWLAGGYAVVLVWLASHALFTEDSGTMVALFMYTFAAATLFLRSQMSGFAWQRYAAVVLVVLVVGRLLFVEVWDMELLARIVTFIVIGVVLVAVAWKLRGIMPKGGVRGEE